MSDDSNTSLNETLIDLIDEFPYYYKNKTYTESDIQDAKVK